MEFVSRYLIGIDLGTTNSAVAYIDTHDSPAVEAPRLCVFEVPQLIAAGEIGRLPTLPSFLYFAGDGDIAPDGLRLPWNNEGTNPVVGALARDQGALVPGRQVSSAKSWLCEPSVDRSAKILPWGAEQTEQTCSPVEASTCYLAHLRDAWNYTMAQGDAALRFENQEIVLTVPASFDPEARELTIEAARGAGLQHVTLLEEPLAAFYAWIAAHRRSLKRYLKDNFLVLICDVGGGTTDFSLIRVRIADGEVRFERTAIGEHLLLGGDNVDLALARRVEEKLNNPKLSLRQRNALRRQSCAAKERLLGDTQTERVSINLLGAGRAVVGGALTADLTREETLNIILEGFLPLTARGEMPARDRRMGLRELGLPYASEPAITKHLAAFLARSAAGETAPPPDNSQPAPLLKPDAVLFNGGFFRPAATRERVVEAIARWFHEKGKRWRPRVLVNDAPESAVAIGASYYNLVRRGGGIRISGGSARAYYIGVQAGPHKTEGLIRAVCVMPRGTEEGTRLDLSGRAFTVLTNRPVVFTLYSSTTRHDEHGHIVELDQSTVHTHAPLITVLRYGKRSREIELEVRLTVSFTEVGTLEIWCESPRTGHRWRLQFQLRGAEPQDAPEEPEEAPVQETGTIIAEESLRAAEKHIRAVFGTPRDAANHEPVTPETLVSRLEAAIGYRKDAWPIGAIRKLCDALIDVAAGRRKGRAFEARWLNLFGFTLRPGFGALLDDWRITQARKIYHDGIIFHRDLQCEVEWLILWRRVAGGLNAGQQQELYQRHAAALGIGAKKRPAHINKQVEREGWLMLASLEHLAPRVRVALGRELLDRIKQEPANKNFLWALGRLGARIPLYGPLNCVVPRADAATWLEELLKLPEMTVDVASAVAQIGARTDDPLRDIDEDLRDAAISRLTATGAADELLESLRRYVEPARIDAQRIFGESLPEGLRLIG
jgi:molecular chaperone DnaK (HSP70)